MLALPLALGCSKVFLQDDGFSEKLHAGCQTEDACRRLQVEADQRVIKCQENTVGYVRCSDARADKLMADSFVEKYETASKKKEEANRKAEIDRRRVDAERERDERERQRDAERKDAEKRNLASSIEHESRLLESCDASEGARAARKRRANILENAAPGAAVRKQCTPRTETHSVKSECKDDNGFKRTCTKTVAGDIVGYACPKSMDQEVVQLGLYQLELVDSYPFPEDRSIRVRDSDCDHARTRVKDLRERLDALGSPTPKRTPTPSSEATAEEAE